MAHLDPVNFDLVRRTLMFDGLPAETVHALLGSARMVDAPRGTILFMRGDPADRFYVVLEGWVKLSRESVDGDEHVIGIFSRGETFAEAAIFGLGRFPVTAEVVERGRLVVIPAAPLLSAIRADGALALGILGVMSHRLRYLVTQVEQIRAKSAAQRVGEFLLRLNPAEEGPATIRLPYDKSLIAARLGMKPETFSRALAKLRDFGVRCEGNAVILAEPATLQRYCADG